MEGEIIGLIAIRDTLKEDAKEAILKLRQMKIKTAILTGDNQQTAEAIAKELGIDEVAARVLPTQKAEKINEFKSLKVSKFKIAFVGDGINDAPALATADLGIAMGAGTDIARETGDIILVKNDLLDVVKALKLSQATFRKIKMGMFWVTLCRKNSENRIFLA